MPTAQTRAPDAYAELYPHPMWPCRSTTRSLLRCAHAGPPRLFFKRRRGHREMRQIPTSRDDKVGAPRGGHAGCANAPPAGHEATAALDVEYTCCNALAGTIWHDRTPGDQQTIPMRVPCAYLQNTTHHVWIKSKHALQAHLRERTCVPTSEHAYSSTCGCMRDSLPCVLLSYAMHGQACF